jgi:hypothetical protein
MLTIECASSFVCEGDAVFGQQFSQHNLHQLVAEHRFIRCSGSLQLMLKQLKRSETALAPSLRTRSPLSDLFVFRNGFPSFRTFCGGEFGPRCLSDRPDDFVGKHIFDEWSAFPHERKSMAERAASFFARQLRS